MLVIAREPPDTNDSADLLRQSDAFSARLYPPESRYQPGIPALLEPSVRFFVARFVGRAVGCAALVVGACGIAELKRMFIDPAARGHGIGKALLDAVESAARREGITRLQLETGIRNRAAVGLYRVCGYVRRGPFGDYADDPLSVFMEKQL